MRKRRQIGVWILAICLILGYLPPTYAAAATEDITPPEIKEVLLSATSVNAPGEVEIIADAPDDVSGCDYGAIIFTNSKTGTKLIAYMSVGNASNKHTLLYEKGKIYGILKFGQYAPSGTYRISSMDIYDKAGNNRSYSETDIPFNIKSLSIEVINESGQEDTTPPEIKEVLISNTIVQAPGEVEIVVDALDDVSGSDYATIVFTNIETGKMITAYISADNVPSKHTSLYEKGKLYGVLKFDQYAPSGTYRISSMNIYDKAGNSRYYSGKDIPFNIKGLSIEVINESGQEDITVAKIEEVLFSKTKVHVPGEVEIVAGGLNDVSEGDHGAIFFTNIETGKKLMAYISADNVPSKHTSLYEKGKFYGVLEFDQYVPSGTYKISSMLVYDKEYNIRYYSEEDIPSNIKNLSIEVINDGPAPDIVTGTNNPNLVKDISSASGSAIIAVDYTSNSMIQKDVFDAIKGTQKTLVMERQGFQWVFEGTSITKDTKNIDLQISTKKITEDTSNGAIIGHTQAANAVVVTFAKNGELPGKSKIRIKADYVLKQYLGENGLYVYYYDNTNDKFELIAQNIKVTQDSYIEFEIDHCSQYVIANKACSINKTETTIGGGAAGGGGGTSFTFGDDGTIQAEFFDAASKSEVKITIRKNKESAAVLINQTGTADGSKIKAKLSSDVLKQIADVTGSKNCSITMNMTDEKGKQLYTIELSKADLVAGKTLTAYVYQKKLDSYVILKSNTCEVAQGGSLEIFFDKLESGNSYRLLNKADAEKTARAIMKTVALKKTTQSAKQGKTVKVVFDSKLNMANIENVTYLTSNKRIAAVSKAGNIKVLQKGTAKITVKVAMNDGTKKNLTMRIKVK